MGWVTWQLNSRSVITSHKNIAICFPEMDDSQQKSLVRQSCIHTGMVFTESAWIWKNSPEKLNPLIESIEGLHLIEAAQEKGNGVILTGPHLGNWEALLSWGGMTLPSSVMYRIPKISEMDETLREARLKTGVQLIVGDRSSVRQMLKVLKSGEVFMLLSDQKPVANSGVFANFFHRPAYTMVLIHRLIEKTNAELLFFHAQRTRHGFKIIVHQSEFNRHEPDPEKFATGLNKMLEKQIRSCPEQFEWSYRRFRPQPKNYESVY